MISGTILYQVCTWHTSYLVIIPGDVDELRSTEYGVLRTTEYNCTKLLPSELLVKVQGAQFTQQMV